MKPAYAALLAVLVALTLACCLIPRHKAPTRHAVHFFGDVDTSKSDRSALGWYVKALTRLLHSLSDPDYTTLFRSDDTTQPFEDRPATGTSMQIMKMIATHVAPKSDKQNTYMVKAWERFAKTVGKDQTSSLIVITTSGYTEGTSQSDHHQIRAYATALSHNPYLKGVAIIGVRPGAWTGLEADLAPLQQKLGRRFVTLSDTDTDLSPVFDLIDTARKGQ